MTDKPYYLFEDWFKGGEVTQRFPDYRQILQAHGRGLLLFYKEEEDWQGDWVAIMTDGLRIALIDGSFGSCSGCDALLGAENAKAYSNVAQEYLRSVRTFESWSKLLEYMRYLQEDPYSDHLFKIAREEIVLLSKVDMPLEASDILCRLHLDDPLSPIHEVAERAKALN